MSDYLNRDAAGIPQALWEPVDHSAREAGREFLTTRRFLDLEGPFGVGMTRVATGSESDYRPAPPAGGRGGRRQQLDHLRRLREGGACKASVSGPWSWTRGSLCCGSDRIWRWATP
jgi:uncharacterized linocin/CFP29 family protein